MIDRTGACTVEEVERKWLALGAWVDEERREGLVADAELVDRVRLRAAGAPHAGMWLAGVPCQNMGTMLSSEEFRSRAGRWLGADICDEMACPYCFGVMDRKGGHAEECMSGGNAVLRRNECRDTVFKIAKPAGTRPVREKAGLLASGAQDRDGGRRPADVLLQYPNGVHTARGRGMPSVALDFAIVNPQGARYREGAAREVLAAAKSYTQYKRDFLETDRKCLGANIDFQPVVWESFGGVSEEGREVLKSLYRLVALNTNTPLTAVAQRYWHRFSVDIQKANHRAFA